MWHVLIVCDVTNTWVGLVSHYAWRDSHSVELVGHDLLQQLFIVNIDDCIKHLFHVHFIVAGPNYNGNKHCFTAIIHVNLL